MSQQRMSMSEYRRHVATSSVNARGRVVAVEPLKTDQPKKSKEPRKPSEGEETIAAQLALLKIPFVREYRFHPVRMWRFDFAFPEHMLAVEFEGGVFTNGGHTRGAAYRSNCEKYNEALCLGWRVIRVMIDQVKSGECVEWVARAIGASGRGA
jgi:very-short-patch-repair endonuclease